MDGKNFEYVKYDGSTSPEKKLDTKYFRGSLNKDDVVVRPLPVPVQAQYVRLYPHNFVGHVSLRWDILQCFEGRSPFLTKPSKTHVVVIGFLLN